MRTFTLALTIWWVLAPLATLRGIGFTQFFGAGVAAGGSSYVEKQSQSGTSAGTYFIGASLTTYWRGVKWTAPSSFTLNRVDVWVSRNGSSSVNYTMEVWSHDSMTDRPASIVGTASASISVADFPDTEDVRTFYPSATITNGTVYYLILKASAVNANVGEWHYVTTSGQIVTWNNNTASWNESSTARRFKYTIYGDS